MGALDMLKRDRFELLSAYLDGEVTASERQQVENWLDTDPAVQSLYQRLLRLRQGFQMMPTPPISQPAEQTVEQVFARLDRRPKRALILWGGGAVAALLIGAITSVFGNDGFMPQFAQSPEPEAPSAAVMIALDQPVVSIPKMAVPASPTTVQPNSSGNLHRILQGNGEPN